MIGGEVTFGDVPSVEGSGALPILLIEDDDGDALLVEELLLDVVTTVDMRRVRSIGEARAALPDMQCVLLDLDLPDAFGLEGLRWLQTYVPEVAVVVLTGQADEHLGQAAVRAGAQDYLVKGQVDGLLLDRVIRYAVERRRFRDVQTQLTEARIYAEENARLERGLLPSPILADPDLRVATRYRPGAQQMLVGGDFYDVVQAADGWVHALVGDVCGHGPDEAALGVCLRVAWRTMVLAGRPVAEIRPIMGQVFEHEQHRPGLFATMTMLSVSPNRTSARLYLAGHPPPLLITPAGARLLAAPVHTPLGIGDMRHWPSGEVELGDSWTVWMYTDGLVEGRIGAGSQRLETEGLIDLVSRSLPAAGEPRSAPDEVLLDSVIARVRELNGGDLTDDLAVLALARRPGNQDG